MAPLLGSLLIDKRRCSGRGTNFFRARQKAAAIADRLSAIVYHGSTTQRQWVSTSFIFRRFIPLVTPIARGGTTQSPPSQVIPVYHGRSAARPADTRRSSLRSGRSAISTGSKKRCGNVE